ncbi:MAG: crossover junction endodeoxyribonuclease RuvC [Chloroflexi bacterium]|nr:crossover junction endodeoxyribonuclease RuvC [Chloroflexota bacterium]
MFWSIILKILGIDPGLTNTGYGLIQVENRNYKSLEGGVIRTKASQPLESRLYSIYSVIKEIVEEFSPNSVAIEELHSRSRFVKTAILLGHARGAAIVAVGEFNIPVFNYQPTQAKNMITGFGGASKEQIKIAVSEYLGESNIIKNEHMADAFSIAICHGMMIEKSI